MQRYKFNKRVQGETESVDQYVTELRLLAKNCRFGELQEELIRDRIICGIKADRLQARMLREDDLTLDKAISICKADEESRKQLKDLTKDDNFKVSSVKKSSRKGNNEGRPAKFGREKQKISSGEVIKCSKCWRDHSSKQCPAYGKVCHACRKLNHFAKCCRSRKVHGIDQMHTDPDILFVGTVDKKPEQSTKTELTKDECFITLEVNETPIKFKVDTGSQANIIPMSMYRELKGPKEPIQASRTSLTSYTGDRLNLVGKCTLKCMNRLLNFFVSETDQYPILGFQASQELDIIKVVMSTNKEGDLKEKYSVVFKGLECLREPYHIELDPEVLPVINAARKVPVAKRSFKA
jgi:hypothetical protein